MRQSWVVQVNAAFKNGILRNAEVAAKGSHVGAIAGLSIHGDPKVENVKLDREP
jgi:hypothetical protein